MGPENPGRMDNETFNFSKNETFFKNFGVKIFAIFVWRICFGLEIDPKASQEPGVSDRQRRYNNGKLIFFHSTPLRFFGPIELRSLDYYWLLDLERKSSSIGRKMMLLFHQCGQ